MNPTDSLFWPYLLPILDSQKAENGVIYIRMSDSNGIDRMLADSRSEDIYPGIFVLRPTYSGQMLDGALLLAKFDVTLFCSAIGNPSDYASEDQTYAHAELIACAITRRLQHDTFSGRCYLEFDSVRLQPVMYHSGVDAAYGYELKLKLGLPANEIFC